jgi:hypothetical protein
MRYRWIAAGLMFLTAGCNRQDAECLGRIGGLVGQRLEKLKPGPKRQAGIVNSIPGYGDSANETEAPKNN